MDAACIHGYWTPCTCCAELLGGGVALVPVAASGMIEVLSSSEDCPAPRGCGLSLAAESRVPEISLWSWTASATLWGRVLLNNSERLVNVDRGTALCLQCGV